MLVDCCVLSIQSCDRARLNVIRAACMDPVEVNPDTASHQVGIVRDRYSEHLLGRPATEKRKTGI